MPYSRPCQLFAICFSIFIIALSSNALASAQTNTIFLPLKITSLHEDNYTETIDKAYQTAVKRHDQQIVDRTTAEGQINYNSDWPPTHKQINAYPKPSNINYIVTGTATVLGNKISIDMVIFDLLDATSKYTMFGNGKVAAIDATLDELVDDVISYTGRFYRISSVKIKGNTRIDSGAILRHIENRSGDNYDPARIRQDLKDIFKMGYFDDVSVDIHGSNKGKNVTFIVKEKEIIASVGVSGNENIKEEDILEILTVNSNTIYNPNQVNKSESYIRQLYKTKGYYNTKVTTKITYPKKDYVAVEYVIHEGTKVYIKDIVFQGNTTFKDKVLLKIMLSSEKNWMSWFNDSGVLKRDFVQEDANRIGSFYQNHGFIEVKIAEPVIEKKGKWLYVTFKIHEGARFKVGLITIDGDLIKPEEELLSLSKLGEEKYFTRDVLRNDTLAFTDLYASNGYAFADINPDTSKDDENQRINVNYHITKGELVYVNRIQIKGNTRTRDKVLRREMTLEETAIYDSSAIKRSTARLKRLEYFEDVSITSEPTDADNTMDVVVAVREKSTGSFSIGAGYSSVDSLMFMAEVSQNNFLGRGQKIGLTANIGGTNTRYSLNFTEPHLNDSKLLFGFDLYSWDHEYDDYTKSSVGGGLRFGYPIWWGWRSFFGIGTDKSSLSDIEQGTTADVIWKSQQIEVTNFITLGVSKDTRNKSFNTSRGARHIFSVKQGGGFLSGDAEFTKYEASTSWYFPIWKELVFHYKLAGGYVQENEEDCLPVFERFYLGGLNTVRGFENGKISHVDDDTDDRYGGTRMVYQNMEFLFPLFKDAGVSGVIFFDAGNVWGGLDEPSDYGFENFEMDQVSMGAGFGFRWLSPMGPLRLEWGKNLDPKYGEDTSVWDFSMGGTF